MSIKLVARTKIVTFNEISTLFDNLEIAQNYLDCLNNQIPTTEKGEYHHIIPKCISHNHNKSNIVYVSLETHFKCHYYLTFVKDNQLRKRMSFAFKQMLNTRKDLVSKNLELYATRYKELLEQKIFSKNYERTTCIKNQIADSVHDYLQSAKPRWVNNGISEKFVPSKDLENLLNNGWNIGRLKNIDTAKKASISTKQVHNLKRQGKYVPSRKALYKKELRQRHFLESLNKQELDKKYKVSTDGISYKFLSIKEIIESGLPYRPHCFFD